MYADAKERLAHRIAYKLAYGACPDSLHVCHICDNPLCVRPSHLFLGTDQDNHNDCVAKGRAVFPPVLRGVSHPMAKLTEPQVLEIRRLLDMGNLTYAAIGQIVGVTKSTIFRINREKSWASVK